MPRKTPRQSGARQPMPATPITNAEIQTALQQDLLQGFDLLDQAYRTLLYSLAMREMRNRDNAEECVQDTLLRAFRGLLEIRYRNPARLATLNTKAWLCKILKNVITDAKLVASRSKAVSLAPYSFRELVAAADYRLDTERDVLREDTLDQLQVLVQALSPEQQQVVALRFVYDLKFAEIGARLDIAEGTARSHLSRALAKLRALIDHSPHGEDGCLKPGDVALWEQAVSLHSWGAANEWLFQEEMQEAFGSQDWPGGDSPEF